MSDHSQSSRFSPLGTAVRLALYAAAAPAVFWMLYSRLAVNHRLPLPRALEADRESFIGKEAGLISYYADRRAAGRPLLLVHSINAAASAYEMRPLFEHYRQTRPVYAIDLPGFGFSDRSNREYSYQLYKQAIIEMLERVGEAADVITLSLSAEFAARAAIQRPDLFHSLTLISPTGFGKQRGPDNEGNDVFYGLLAFPLWSQPVYDLLALRSSLHWFLEKSFEGSVDYGVEAYAFKTAHQPGARFAPLYFVSGKLFTPQARETLYDPLTLPVLALYDRDYYVAFTHLPAYAAAHPNWTEQRIAPTRGLPHWEKLQEVISALDTFWQTQTAAQGTS